MTLGLVLYPGCLPAGLFMAADLLRAANLAAGRQIFQVSWLSVGDGPVDTGSGLTLPAADRLGADGCDAYLLPGAWLASAQGLDTWLHSQAHTVAALAELPAGRDIWSYCTSVALMAQAGRLVNQPATATWWLAAPLRDRFRDVKWQFEWECVEARGAVTASGANGYLPLLMRALAQHLNQHQVDQVEETLMLPQPRPRAAVFQALDIMPLTDPRLRRLLLWAQQQPAHALSLRSAAELLSMSTRTLCRKVREQTDLPAATWMRRIKLRQAADMLLRDPSPLKTVAEHLGFASEASFHRGFLDTTGLTPGQFRERYRRTFPGRGP
jgi:transcriptional regulator GlxA family with amidase domain